MKKGNSYFAFIIYRCKILAPLRLQFSHIKEYKFRHGFSDKIINMSAFRTELETIEPFLSCCHFYSTQRLGIFENPYKVYTNFVNVTLFRMRRRAKRIPPTLTIFSLGISPKNSLISCFSPFFILVQTFNSMPSASSKLLNLNQEHASKNCFFWSNPYQIDIIITSVIEMLQLSTFAHMITSTI